MGGVCAVKYKAGDFVRVIEKYDENADYYINPPYVVSSMLPMQGRVYQIEYITDIGVYTLRFRGSLYTFTDEMISERVIPVGTDDFIPYNENIVID